MQTMEIKFVRRMARKTLFYRETGENLNEIKKNNINGW